MQVLLIQWAYFFNSLRKFLSTNADFATSSREGTPRGVKKKFDYDR